MQSDHSSSGDPLRALTHIQDARGQNLHAVMAQALDQISEAVVITDSLLEPPGPRIIYVNEAFCRLSGYSPQEVLGRTPRLLQGPRSDRAVLERLKSFLLVGEEFHGSIFNYRKDGTEYEVEWRVSPVRDADGKITHFIGLQRDVTSERDLERRMQQLFQTDLLGIVIVDSATGVIRQANDYFCRLTGYPMAELVGKVTLAQLTPDKYRDADNRASDELRSTKACHPYEKELICRSGKQIAVVYGASAGANDEREFVGFVLDNSARHAAENTLIESHQRLEQMVEMRTAELRLLFERQAALSRIDVESVNSDDELQDLFDAIRQVVREYLPADGEVGLIVSNRCDSQSGEIPQACGEVMNRCCPVILDHPVSEGNPRIPGFLGVPLVARGEILGVLYAQNSRRMNYGDHDVEFMNALARRAAVAVIKQRLMASLRHKNEILASEIRSKELAEEALAHAIVQAENARTEAEGANAAKSEFLSRMSHELRTPLNAVLGFAQLMEMRASNDQDRSALGHIIAGGQHLLNLINEVLDISRIESGRLAISVVPVPLYSTLKQCLDMFSTQMQDSHINVEWEGEWNAEQMTLGDPQRLRQVFINIISNAIKYNKIGGRIIIILKHLDDQKLTIHFVDEGIGIPKDHLSRLFTPFDRLGAEQLGIEGVGLGLCLTRQIVHALGGEIEIDSQEQVGTTVMVKLPVAQPGTQGATPGADFSVSPGEFTLRKGHDETTRVLYIEDNTSNIRLVRRLVESMSNVLLTHALTGVEGLRLAELEKPDLILLDLHLPDISGVQVLKLLKHEPSTAASPVVVVSADATETSMRNLIELGATDYLTKPLDIRKFSAVLRSILNGR